MVVIFEKYSRNAADETQLMLLVKEIQLNWSHLGVNELTEAFNLWSLQELGELEMYGSLDITFLNKLLVKYESFRNTKLDKYLQKQRHIKYQEMQEEKQKQEQQEREELKNLSDYEIKKQIKTYKKYKDIPFWLARLAWNRQLYKLSPAMREEYKVRAKKLAEIELKDERVKQTNKIALRELINTYEKTLTARIKVIALQLAAFERV